MAQTDQPSNAAETNSPQCTDDNVDLPLYATNEFRMYCYKVLPCSKRFSHNWQTCPFAHPGEKARRRCLRSHKYSAALCPNKQQGQECPRGDDCPLAHSVFEFWLHPDMYRTQLCNDAGTCKRNICFFAHSLAELRVPSLAAKQQAGTALSAGTSSSFGVLHRTVSAQSGPSVGSSVSDAGSPVVRNNSLTKQPPLLLSASTAGRQGSSCSSNAWEQVLQSSISPPNSMLGSSNAAAQLQYQIQALQQQQQQQQVALSSSILGLLVPEVQQQTTLVSSRLSLVPQLALLPDTTDASTSSPLAGTSVAQLLQGIRSSHVMLPAAANYTAAGDMIFFDSNVALGEQFGSLTGQSLPQPVHMVSTQDQSMWVPNAVGYMPTGSNGLDNPLLYQLGACQAEGVNSIPVCNGLETNTTFNLADLGLMLPGW